MSINRSKNETEKIFPFSPFAPSIVWNKANQSASCGGVQMPDTGFAVSLTVSDAQKSAHHFIQLVKVDQESVVSVIAFDFVVFRGYAVFGGNARSFFNLPVRK